MSDGRHYLEMVFDFVGETPHRCAACKRTVGVTHYQCCGQRFCTASCAGAHAPELTVEPPIATRRRR